MRYNNPNPEITPAIAAAMLATFSKPTRANLSGGLVAGCCSTGDYLNNPYVTAGIIRDDDTVDVYLSWEGINGITDVTDALGGYSFTVYNSDVRNWQDTVRVVREHLRNLANPAD